MAGALTANAVDTETRLEGILDVSHCFGVVRYLSPVDGANNALLTAVFTIATATDDVEITAQWHRVASEGSLDALAAGAAIGDPFVFACPGDELIEGPYVVQAVDRSPTNTSAYGIFLVADVDGVDEVAEMAVDAVLFD